jgi:GntR family transcriptional regulator, carbon starvation induced regulator
MPADSVKQFPSPMRPASVASATQGAYDAIRRMILVGDLRPGEKLKIDVLKARLDTVASPVREALSLLTSDQLVERIDQRGFRAAPASQANFDEILALRCTLEDMALRQGIANADQAWEEHLVLSLHRLARETSGSSDAHEDLHKAFHMALLAGCGSPVLLRFCSQLYDLNVRYRYLAGRSLNYKSRDVAAEHVGILEAAVQRDADLASDRLLSHYRKTGAFLRQSDLLAQG